MDPAKILDYCLHCDELKIFCGEQSEKINGLCEKHQDFSGSLDCYVQKEKSFCTTRIKQYLDENENVEGKENKAKIVKEIYDLLCKHKKFLFDHHRFQKTVLNKLEEFTDKQFANILHIFDAQKYINILFPFKEAKITDESNESNESDNEANVDHVKIIEAPPKVIKERVNIIMFDDPVTEKFTTLDVGKSVMATIYDYIELEYGTVAKETAPGLYGDKATKDALLKDDNTAGVCIIKINDNLYEMYTKNITKVNTGWIRNNIVKTVKAEKVGRFIVPHTSV